MAYCLLYVLINPCGTESFFMFVSSKIVSVRNDLVQIIFKNFSFALFHYSVHFRSFYFINFQSWCFDSRSSNTHSYNCQNGLELDRTNKLKLFDKRPFSRFIYFTLNYWNKIKADFLGLISCCQLSIIVKTIYHQKLCLL